METIVVRTSMLAATIATATEDRVASNPPTDNGLKSLANGDDTDDLLDYLYEIEDGLGELVRALRTYVACTRTYVVYTRTCSVQSVRMCVRVHLVAHCINMMLPLIHAYVASVRSLQLTKQWSTGRLANWTNGFCRPPLTDSCA